MALSTNNKKLDFIFMLKLCVLNKAKSLYSPISLVLGKITEKSSPQKILPCLLKETCC